MREAIILLAVGGSITGAFALVGILLTDFLTARRERIKEQTAAREAESASLIRAHDAAMQALRDQMEDMTEDRDWWRDTATAQGDGWHGQRRSRR